MRPTATRSNRSSVHHLKSSPIPSPSTTSSVYHHHQQQQQQQQQILYAPVSNPMVTLQPCGTALHPSCVYPSVQSHVVSPSSAHLHLQGKNNRWHVKNKPSRGQQYYQQQQQQLSYNPKPVVLFDQPSTNVTSIPPSTTSFLVASSTFTHAGPLHGEHYSNNSGVTHLLPQPLNFKPPDVQTLCLIQDRQNIQQQHQQQQQQQQQQHPQMQSSYYNISATNTCSLQTVNANSSFPLASLASFNNSQFPVTVQSSPLFSNPPVGLVLAPPRGDKPSLDFTSLKHNADKISSACESQVLPIGHSENGWPAQIETFAKNDAQTNVAGNSRSLESAERALQKSLSVVAKTDEEHYSDESSASFDFTIEAEKMVSALCNTTSSNDLGKEESKPGNKADSTTLFSGAGDNVSNKASWFIDFCSEYENRASIGVQTDGPCADRSQYPELIRKTAYWGCTQAESVLDFDGSQTDSKRNWLTCLSSATRTAITKSSTCIPVFAGDRVFADDLVNALLRISNGWLSLDNYLNKQHFPNLLDRLDPELIARFQTWEESTCELLKQIVRTFQKFGENKEVTDQKRNATSSFPGDVSLYTTYDLFVPLPSNSFSEQSATGKNSSLEKPRSETSASLPTSGLHNFQYNSSCQQDQQSTNSKESKLRSKWTITENLSSVINTTKSVPNVSVSRTIDVGGLASHKLRTKDTPFKKFDFTQKSLNAEFCQLRNKVMESSGDVTKDRRHDHTDDKLTLLDNAESVRLQHPAVNAPMSYSGLYARNCLSFTFPLPGHSDSSYPTSGPGVPVYSVSYPSSGSYPSTDINSRSGRNNEQIYGAKSANINPVYVGRSQTDQLELPAVPRNKMTLLSQIEPRTFDKESEEMAANLSAWFASMRNSQPPAVASTFEEPRTSENSAPRLFVQEMPKYSMIIAKQPQIDANRQFQALQNLPNIQSTPWAAGSFAGNRYHVQHAPEEYDSSEDVRVYMKPGSYNVPKKRHQRRLNRRSSNSTTSRNVHASGRHSVCDNNGKGVSIPASSTPLSHTNATTLSTNVTNATLIKTSFPPASQLPVPLFNLESSPRILKRTESLSQDARQDVTWKAACASAEILLEALNVKDCGNTFKNVECNDSSSEKEDKNEEHAEALAITSQQSDLKHDNVDCASSYEASEDDSGSTCRLSPSTSVVSVSQSREDENSLGIKTNVKTDSWLIRTLSNASTVGKQKRRKDDVDQRSSGSSNSSGIDVKPDQLVSPLTANLDIKTRATIVDSEYPAIFSREHVSGSFAKSDDTPTKELESHVGRATYSETVRRSMKTSSLHLEKKEPLKSCATDSSVTTVIPIPGRKCQRKDPEQSYQLLHKSRRSADKKTVKNADDLQSEEGSCRKVGAVKVNNITPKLSTTTKTSHGKKKDLEHLEGKCASKSGDQRGWSVWCGSRRKQSLNSLAFNKLEMIHRTIWQMNEARIIKYAPSYDNKDGQSSSTLIMEDYCKVVKSPMFLEIIEYKLKNRIYHKVEHAVKDFRRIINNARLYHQHDNERTRKIEVLSKKLEDLLEEHFGNLDFDNITGSPRDDSLTQLRLKTSG
ncbi:PREDICTED: uncharacterized protein LOC105449204 isoform X2 [Wasmannia auropunctata]|uniref:uncharacterized protein LOC105449204 isoform X2 n=1 Tax=Wasmannia auropunctata TaxID=64793 RepID=UPI0005EEB197|nr:PREDICTED: uncharacterized protein LOC105449204 isoform X2 [Wasmannia auropunctata]